MIIETRGRVDLSEKDYIELVRWALKEDIGTGDITTNSIVPPEKEGTGILVSKNHGILCGINVFTSVFKELDQGVTLEAYKKDGDVLHYGEEVAKISGRLRPILTGERVALNFIQRMSGVATKANQAVSWLRDSSTYILDTRKTFPGYRLIDKYAVRTGGAYNHRLGLFDMALIKDNHIAIAGSIEKAVALVRQNHPDVLIEVEAATLEQIQEALDCKVPIIMFDNMDNPTVQQGLRIVNDTAKVEISGNITEERISELADLGVNYISMGEITHSAKAFDFSLMID